MSYIKEQNKKAQYRYRRTRNGTINDRMYSHTKLLIHTLVDNEYTRLNTREHLSEQGQYDRECLLEYLKEPNNVGTNNG